MTSTKPRRVARYLRVSTRDQHAHLQADETNQLVANRGWTLIDTYLDQGFSGSKDKRPDLTRLLADARKGKFDTLVVWKSDRLFRSLKHMLITLDELAALNIDFVSVTEPFDTTTPQGRLLLHLVSAMGEFERGLICERTRAGLAAARRRGAKIGRPRARVDLVRARALLAQGKSVRQVARVLGLGATTLRRALGHHAAQDDIAPQATAALAIVEAAA